MKSVGHAGEVEVTVAEPAAHSFSTSSITSIIIIIIYISEKRFRCLRFATALVVSSTRTLDTTLQRTAYLIAKIARLGKVLVDNAKWELSVDESA